MAGEHKFEVEVLTPEGEVFNGEVRQVSTRTAVGEIGILANHAPLLAALQPAELRLHVTDSETKRYAQAHGWLQVFGNHARLLVEEAIAPTSSTRRAQRAARRRRAALRRGRGGQRGAGAGRQRPRPGGSFPGYKSGMSNGMWGRGSDTPPRELTHLAPLGANGQRGLRPRNRQIAYRALRAHSRLGASAPLAQGWRRPHDPGCDSACLEVPLGPAVGARMRDELVALAKRLIGYDTSEPEATSEAAGFVKGWLEARGSRLLGEEVRGLPVLRAEVGPEGAPTVVLHGHLDVVPGAARTSSSRGSTATASTGAAPMT